MTLLKKQGRESLQPIVTHLTQFKQISRKNLKNTKKKHLHCTWLIRVDEDNKKEPENHPRICARGVNVKVSLVIKTLLAQIRRVVLNHRLGGPDAPVHHLGVVEEVDHDEAEEADPGDCDGDSGRRF